MSTNKETCADQPIVMEQQKGAICQQRTQVQRTMPIGIIRRLESHGQKGLIPIISNKLSR
jgi:hypothetical protein